MQSALIDPKEFIKNTESHEEYTCNICYQICVRPARCAGPCKKIFCLKCVSQTRTSSGLSDNNTKDQCPMRCSSPFLVDILPQLDIEFECPYNAKQCKIPILSLQQFNDHYKKCPFVPEIQIHFKKMQNQFRCMKGHQLEFFVGTFQQMCQSFCSICNEKKLCRAICPDCGNLLYCVDCRTPPCQKGKCPVGHQMKLWKSSNLSYICDICGISAAVSNSNIYDDVECNFGICEECFQKIEQKAEENLPKIKLQTNKHDECEKEHKLTVYEGEKVVVSCSKCKKQKQCIKECKQCQNRYCLACKVAFVQGGEQKCSLNHQFVPISAETLGAEQEFNFTCMRCQKQQNLIYHDKICRIRLCLECFDYSLTLDVQKHRLVQNLTCKKNHVLHYVTNPFLDKAYCTLCKRKTLGKLCCTYCQKTQRGYCCMCKPLQSFSTCYHGHKLVKCEIPEDHPCSLCEKNEKDMIGCKKCLFFICRNCEHQFDETRSFYGEQSQMIDQSEESSQY